MPGRFVLAYGNIQQGPWEWSTAPEFRDFVQRRIRPGDDMLGFQLAFDVTGDPGFPERAAFEVARDLDVPVTTHAGVWGATNDDGIRLMYDNGFAKPGTIYVHAATLEADSYQRIAATGGSVSVSTESEQSCGQGFPPPGPCAPTTCRCHCRRTPACGGAATCSQPCAPRWAPTGPASTSRRTRAEQVVEWATKGGAAALSLDSVVGTLEPGKKADVVLIKNEHSPAMFPLLNPYGHVAFQAQRGDVHTVVVNGRVVKRDHRLVDIDLAAARSAVTDTVEHLQSTLGPDAWQQGMNPDIPDIPDIPETKLLDNPYAYTDFRTGTTRGREV